MLTNIQLWLEVSRLLVVSHTMFVWKLAKHALNYSIGEANRANHL